jgi:membrane-associated HD superfamily phosphohydrolase
MIMTEAIEKADRPPLRIHHLLIWTTLTAAIISGCIFFERHAKNGPPIESRVIIAGLVLGAITIAGALTIVGCGLNWRRKGIAFPQSPGDWLLTVVAGSFAFVCLTLSVMLTIFAIFGDDDWFGIYYAIVATCALIAWVVAHAQVIGKRTETRAWRVAFVALLISPFAMLFDGVFVPGVIAVIACMLWAACVDWRKRIDRNWTHWCGVACALSLGISLICVFGF